jgi:hypothetical protein
VPDPKEVPLQGSDQPFGDTTALRLTDESGELVVPRNFNSH